MLEALGGSTKNNSSNGPYKYLGEGNIGNYSDLYQALGLPVGSTIITGQAFLRYYSQEEAKNCIVPKTGIAVNISFNTLLQAGLVAGKNITFNGKNYFARLIRGANTLPLDQMGSVPDSTIYPAGAVFNFCEFNLLFNPIIDMSGKSPEGMAYGDQWKYQPGDLGFITARQANSTFCANYNSSNVLLRGSSDQRFAAMRSRGTTSTYWSLRPILFEI